MAIGEPPAYVDPLQEVFKRLEPSSAPEGRTLYVEASIAISLKRIADVLEDFNKWAQSTDIQDIHR